MVRVDVQWEMFVVRLRQQKHFGDGNREIGI